MKSVYKFLSIIAVGVLFSSCEDVVQVKLDEGSKLYVIDAFIDDLPGIQTIKVTTNDSYFSNREAPGVSGAEVVLNDLTASKSYTFTYSADGKYVYNVAENNPILVVGHQYQINVSLDGSTYTALSTVNRKANVLGILSLTPEEAGGFGPPNSAEIFYCNVIAFDKTDANTDYYLVKTIRNDTLFFGPSDINIAIDGTQGPVNSTEFDSTLFTPPVSFLNFRSFLRGDKCEVQIHSISKEAYYFFVQANTQINNGGLFATTPENVKTNIVTPNGAKYKAVGWFNTAGVSRSKITVP